MLIGENNIERIYILKNQNYVPIQVYKSESFFMLLATESIKIMIMIKIKIMFIPLPTNANIPGAVL